MLARMPVTPRRVASFSGQRVLITGGSSGIGLALARAVVRKGAHVCIAARDPDRLAMAIGTIGRAARTGQTVCSVRMDVTSQDSVHTTVPQAIERLGAVDILINNAGSARPGYFDRLQLDDFEKMLAVNYLGPVRVIQALLPHFLERHGGRIVNVTSMLGFMGTFGYSAYAGSKHALAGFTEVLRQDLLPHGIRVHLCYPPTTKTPGLEAENAVKPPEAWAIEGSSRAFPPDAVAQAILVGLRKGRFHILVGLDSHLIWRVQRFAPWLVRALTDRILRRASPTEQE